MNVVEEWLTNTPETASEQWTRMLWEMEEFALTSMWWTDSFIFGAIHGSRIYDVPVGVIYALASRAAQNRSISVLMCKSVALLYVGKHQAARVKVERHENEKFLVSVLAINFVEGWYDKQKNISGLVTS